MSNKFKNPKVFVVTCNWNYDIQYGVNGEKFKYPFIDMLGYFRINSKQFMEESYWKHDSHEEPTKEQLRLWKAWKLLNR